MVVPYTFQPCTALGSLLRLAAGLSPLARLKVVGFLIFCSAIQLSLLSLVVEPLVGPPSLYCSEVSQVDRVFLFAFFAVDHLVAGNV